MIQFNTVDYRIIHKIQVITVEYSKIKVSEYSKIEVSEYSRIQGDTRQYCIF